MATGRDYSGMRFGRLTALRATGERAERGWLWVFQCDCGQEIRRVATDIATANNASCGCARIEYCRSRHIKKTCAWCHSHFDVLKGKAKRRSFCSPACRSASVSAEKSGPGSPFYIDGTARSPEKRNAQTRAYRKANPERVAVRNSAMRAKRKQVIGTFTRRDVRRLRHIQGDRCATCSTPLGGGGHVDHIIAIAKGGTNFTGNLQLLCGCCNLRKNDLLPIVFRQKLRAEQRASNQ